MDALLGSALTKLLWLGLVAFLIWKFAKAKTTSAFWAGYAIGSALLLWVMTQKVNPVAGDKVYSDDADGDGVGGTVNDYATRSAGRGLISNDWLKNVKF